MRRMLGVVLALGAAVAITAAWRANARAAPSALQGAWVVTTWEVDGEALSAPQPGMIVFTGTHYTMMYVNGAEARARYAGAEMTDAEVLEAYGTLTANAGRYEVKGNELTTRAYVAKDPNYMGNWPENAATYTFQVDGNTLHLRWPADWSDKRSGTFRKVEGELAP